MSKMTWSFYQLWNQSLEQGEKRTTDPRNRIWASEVGGSYLDRYLKMTGVEPSNPPDERSLRKFEAGHIWEWLVGLVLKRAGVLLDEQEWVEHRYPMMLPVTGKLDYLAGGTPDWVAARQAIKELEEMDVPDFLVRTTRKICDHFNEKYLEGMKKIVLEIKSASSFSFERKFNTGMGDPKHILQTFHYLKAKNMDEGHLVYVCKDDCRMMELGIMNPSHVEAVYKEDIAAMTGFIDRQEKPPKEAEVVFREDGHRFAANWKVAYSPYLTKIYGYGTQMDFENKYKSQVARWNRVFKRVLEKKNLTKMNKEVIAEISKQFPFEELIVKAMPKGEK